MSTQRAFNLETPKMITKTFLLKTALIIFIAAQANASGDKSVTETISDSLKGDWGQINVDLRYRYERVEQDGLKTANGDPIRLRLGYLTPKLSGFQGFAEFEGSTPVFLDDYNDNSNGKDEYAVIADPSEAELNQVWLSYDLIEKTVLRAGRQRILLDNQRFIGNVGWRQMEQTYDAVNLFSSSFGDFSAYCVYIWNVRNTASQDVNMQSPLLNFKYTFPGIGSLSAYGYWLDYNDPDNSGPSAFAFSTQTLGLRFDGSREVVDNLNLLYTAETARQEDYQNNPEDYAAHYLHLILGMMVPNSESVVTNIGGKLGYEVLGSDNNISLKTPLGTNHAFNGWADQFLTAPPEGLRDLYAALYFTWLGVKADIVYHDFRADTGGANFGSEIDLSLTKKFTDNYILQAKYADYNADEFKTDVKKFWLQFTVNF